MLTSWSEVSTPAELSMKSVLILPPQVAYSMRPSWVSPRLPPSPTQRARTCAPFDPQPVVGLVADVGVGLGLGLDVGADAAVPQQVDGRLERSADQRRRVERGDVRGQAERAAYRLADRDRLQRARVDPAALGDQRRRRSRPSSSAAARRAAAARRSCGAGSGSGSRNTWRWSNAATRRRCSLSSIPLPKTSPLMSPMPTQVKSSALGVDAELAEVPDDRLPGAAGGDAHRLVVVAGRAARGEGVAEPEALLERDGVGGVGERGRALVGGDDEVGVVAVVAHDVRRRHDLGPSGPTRLSVTSSRLVMKIL